MRITELRQARLGVTASLLLLTIGVVALGGFSVGRKVASFQPVGVAAEAVDGELRVLSANENSELLPDDIVVLVNGERPLSLDELAELLLRRSESDLFVLRETEGGEELVSARHGLPGLVIDWAYLALSLTGIGYLLIGLYTLTRQRSRQTLLFHLWALLSAALYLLTPIPPYDGTDRLFFLVDGFCRLLLPPLTLHFFLVFPERPGSPWVRRLIPALYLPATVLLVSQLDAVLGANLLPAPTAASIAFQDRAELVLLVAYALAGAAVLGKNLLARESWEQGRQTQWIAFGVAGGYLPFLLLYVVPFALELSVPAWLDVAAVTPLALVPLSFAYALLRYRLWDIKVITRDNRHLRPDRTACCSWLLVAQSPHSPRRAAGHGHRPRRPERWSSTRRRHACDSGQERPGTQPGTAPVPSAAESARPRTAGRGARPRARPRSACLKPAARAGGGARPRTEQPVPGRGDIARRGSPRTRDDRVPPCRHGGLALERALPRARRRATRGCRPAVVLAALDSRLSLRLSSHRARAPSGSALRSAIIRPGRHCRATISHSSDSC